MKGLLMVLVLVVMAMPLSAQVTASDSAKLDSNRATLAKMRADFPKMVFGIAKDACPSRDPRLVEARVNGIMERHADWSVTTVVKVACEEMWVGMTEWELVEVMNPFPSHTPSRASDTVETHSDGHTMLTSRYGEAYVSLMDGKVTSWTIVPRPVRRYR